MTQPISRRTVAKGAAWATPAIALAGAAPAFAASPGYDFFVECSKATIGFRTAGAS